MGNFIVSKEIKGDIKIIHRMNIYIITNISRIILLGINSNPTFHQISSYTRTPSFINHTHQPKD